MVRLWAVAFAILTFAILAAEPLEAQDTAGWSDTRWGMSPDELMKLHPEMSIGKDYLGGFTAGVIPNVAIAGAPFTAYLRFAGVGGLRLVGSTQPEPPQGQWRLAEVELYYSTNDGSASAVCDRVAEALLGKYGPPTRHEPGGFGDMRLWVLPKTTVRQSAFNSLRKAECRVMYKATESGDKL